jgi:hypothetical protein
MSCSKFNGALSISIECKDTLRTHAQVIPSIDSSDFKISGAMSCATTTDSSRASSRQAEQCSKCFTCCSTGEWAPSWLDSPAFSSTTEYPAWARRCSILSTNFSLSTLELLVEKDKIRRSMSIRRSLIPEIGPIRDCRKVLQLPQCI